MAPICFDSQFRQESLWNVDSCGIGEIYIAPKASKAEHSSKRRSFRTWDVAELRSIAPREEAVQDVKLESTI
jgi:hypothetical protein